MSEQRIRELNDKLRTTFIGGQVVLTRGVRACPRGEELLKAVQTFQFHGVDGNNPYGENDFGEIVLDGEAYFFKIAYYDTALKYHSPDPADPSVTRRVMTVMRADEY